MIRTNAKLKQNLKIGSGNHFSISNREVTIIESENHPIYGKRYKIIGYDEWFEENAFEYIER